MTLGRFFHVLVMFGAVLICGCGSGQPTVPRLHPVSGVVTLNDELLPDADVVFHLQSKAPADKSVPAGKTDQQGQYELISGKTLGLAPGIRPETQKCDFLGHVLLVRIQCPFRRGANVGAPGEATAPPRARWADRRERRRIASARPAYAVRA